MRLKAFLNPDFVVRHLHAQDVEGIVRELAEQAEAAGVASADVVGEKLLEREQAHPTVMGGGLAIPHATVPGLQEPVIGVATADAPIPFGGPSLDPVNTFFILLSPPGHEREHVKLLARICRLARHEGFMDDLARARDPQELMHLVEAVDDQHA
ncbi:MAG: PTS sugar transporter subunit IIA [Gemmatimonadota bacterium]